MSPNATAMPVAPMSTVRPDWDSTGEQGEESSRVRCSEPLSAIEK